MKERQEKKQDQYYEMANAPISKIIPKLAVPTIISKRYQQSGHSGLQHGRYLFCKPAGNQCIRCGGNYFFSHGHYPGTGIYDRYGNRQLYCPHDWSGKQEAGGRTGFYCFLYRLWRGTGDRGDRQCQYRTACKNAGIYRNDCSLCGGVCFLYFCGGTIYDMFLHYE